MLWADVFAPLPLPSLPPSRILTNPGILPSTFRVPPPPIPKERNLKDFFNAMEANVLRNIQRGDVTGSLVDEEARKRRESDPNLPAEAHDTFVEDGEMVESSFRKESGEKNEMRMRKRKEKEKGISEASQ